MDLPSRERPPEHIVLRVGARKARLVALACGGFTLACEGPVEPDACAPPTVSHATVTPVGTNVLAAIVTADVLDGDSVSARFGRVGEALDGATPAYSVSQQSTIAVPVLGLRNDATYNIELVAWNDCGSTRSSMLDHTTGSLPADLPRYTATGTNPSPGYVAFAAGSYGVVIDNIGRIVWYHRFPNGPGLNFQPQPNGRYVARPTPSAGQAATWVEIDALGNTTRTLGCSGGLPSRLHDMIAAPDGSYWLMCDEVRTVDLSSYQRSTESLVMGTLIQRRGANGDVLFEWSPFDHSSVDIGALEAGDLSGPVINWTHGNAIDLTEDGNLIVSFRNLSEVVKIDTRSGAVLWRMGGARNQFTFSNTPTPAFARQHGVRALGANRLQLLDNLGERNASRSERYEVNESGKIAQLIGWHASTSGAIALIGGTAQPLRGGGTLVSFGNGASVEEFDDAGAVVWKIEGNPGYVFRAHRIRSLYTPGMGDPR